MWNMPSVNKPCCLEYDIANVNFAEELDKLINYEINDAACFYALYDNESVPPDRGFEDFGCSFPIYDTGSVPYFPNETENGRYVNFERENENFFLSGENPSSVFPCEYSSICDYNNVLRVLDVCKQRKLGEKLKKWNNEKRKEKSRDAARCRRSKETEIFADLAAAIPVSQEQVSQLDKASIMRLAISYLRVRDMINLIPALPGLEEDVKSDDSTFLKSLDGFLLVLSNDGDIVYLSENVSDYLGIGQIDLMGQNIFDYSHPCDHEEIRELFSDKVKNEGNDSQKSFFIRLKCTLTSKGRSVNLKSATYKVLHLKGHILRPECSQNEIDNKLKNCFAAIANPIPHPSNIEEPLPKQTFVTKHSLDMKFIHADDEIMKNVLGYYEEELLGKSVYEYHHAMDSDSIISAYKCLFSKGQCETTKYRFLAKNGGYVWVLTQATLIYDKTGKAQSVVCVNYVISGVECENELYSACQLSCVTEDDLSTKIEDSEVVLLEEVPLEVEDEDTDSSVDCLDGDGLLGPKRNTQKILTQRTEEMSRGFLTFTEDSGLTMLKEEPDDLTHLAPVASDVCVPLEDHPFLSEVFDDLLLKENFNPLMMDEPLDPFISYRDTYDMSPELLSPTLSKNYDSSLPSLNSPSNSLGEDDHISTFANYTVDDDKLESTLRPASPYIPMTMDDLPLLLSSSNDLMWSNSSSPVPPSPTNKSANDSSSLAQLLSTTVKTTMKSNTSDLGQSIRSESSTSHSNKRSMSSSSSGLSNKRMKTEQQKEKENTKTISWKKKVTPTSGSNLHHYLLRVNSKSLLVPETQHQPITSLLTLTDRDYEVNAPVNSSLLQGEDLIKALEICDTI
ncbi:hypoxia-inducible factor 1-alpha isoform X2 [Harmonia axyridis]|uniref:hypoxia-inducible factor 1-alpha isoform X2 n=1 Tax=Harmonia axyridis TaxID=115357 RepID=UPI001E275850|nr:hypoxia-inducible factor 1-alpha isoform X2 [Harmonia axyridis]